MANITSGFAKVGEKLCPRIGRKILKKIQKIAVDKN